MFLFPAVFALLGGKLTKLPLLEKDFRPCSMLPLWASLTPQSEKKEKKTGACFDEILELMGQQ